MRTLTKVNQGNSVTALKQGKFVLPFLNYLQRSEQMEEHADTLLISAVCYALGQLRRKTSRQGKNTLCILV